MIEVSDRVQFILLKVIIVVVAIIFIFGVE